MTYLLDTHALIWSLFETKKLSKKAHSLLENKSNIIYVSSVSFWEISLKYSLGKLQLSGVLPNELPKLSLSTGYTELSLTPKHAATYYHLKKTEHKDPFDRMLIWQAIQRKLTLVTIDEKIRQYKSEGLKTIW